MRRIRPRLNAPQPADASTRITALTRNRAADSRASDESQEDAMAPGAVLSLEVRRSQSLGLAGSKRKAQCVLKEPASARSSKRRHVQESSPSPSPSPSSASEPEQALLPLCLNESTNTDACPSTSATEHVRAAPEEGAACNPPRTSASTAHHFAALPEEALWQRYHVSERVLGTGQFGSVRECVERATGRRLACKTLRKSGSGGPGLSSQVEDVRREAALMARLAGHQGVVQVQGLFEGPNSMHLVMELCEGGDLFDEVLRRQRFEERDAAFVFAQIASAIAASHSQGIFHRDLKPENVLLAHPPVHGTAPGAPRVKLADFGLATEMRAGDKLRGIAGSPFYMAPEVLSEEYDFAADVWSLGVILYILLSGTPPFWGEKDEDIFAAIRGGHIDFSAQCWNSVSAEAKGLLQCLLTKDPKGRPSARRTLSHPWILRHCSAPTPAPSMTLAQAPSAFSAVRAL